MIIQDLSLNALLNRKSALFCMQAFRVFRTNDVNVQMISQGASKVLALNSSIHSSSSRLEQESIHCFSLQVNISLIVNDSEAEVCVKALHHSFFESEESGMNMDAASFSNGTVVQSPRH